MRTRYALFLAGAAIILIPALVIFGGFYIAIFGVVVWGLLTLLTPELWDLEKSRRMGEKGGMRDVIAGSEEQEQGKWRGR